VIVRLLFRKALNSIRVKGFCLFRILPFFVFAFAFVFLDDSNNTPSLSHDTALATLPLYLSLILPSR
ncbi:hypothetical protein QN372_09300, partial [Undibacterium sp. RTI2.1]|uniref:hypothetical protein n=1 Tax=unclassified Undibacterium TaxID=2630295 RepID=UPI002B223B88